jgi:hypothetical protein
MTIHVYVEQKRQTTLHVDRSHQASSLHTLAPQGPVPPLARFESLSADS